MFYRLNNGKPLSAIELTRVKAKSLDMIKDIGKHEIFTEALSAKALNKYTNEDITIKGWAILNVEKPSLETKDIRPLIRDAEITAEQADTLKAVFTRILEAYKMVKAFATKESDKAAKRILTRTHLISICRIVKRSINENISIDDLEDFLFKFYSGKQSASTDESYNDAATKGSGKPENIAKRLNALEFAFNQYLKSQAA
jgi:hypothetical protein